MYRFSLSVPCDKISPWPVTIALPEMLRISKQAGEAIASAGERLFIITCIRAKIDVNFSIDRQCFTQYGMGMLIKRDIDWLKSELVPALSDQVKKDLSERLDWIATMLDKQAGNLQSIDTEITLIRGSLDKKDSNKELLTKRVERLEKNLNLPPFAD